MTTIKILTDLISKRTEKEMLCYIKKDVSNKNVDWFEGISWGAALIKGKNSAKGIIFNAHVDTVPAGDLANWKTYPYKAAIKRDRLYGLGASDEKCTVAILIQMVDFFKKIKPDCDVWLNFVGQEEVSGAGSKNFVQWFQKLRMKEYGDVAVVVGEPTGLKIVEIGHKGNVFIKLTTYGQSGHGSRPELVKKHAVFEMIKTKEKIEVLNQVWSKKYLDKLLGAPSVGVFTTISAGSKDAVNKFPDTCEATLDIRTTPMLHTKVLQEVKKAVGFGVKVEYLHDPASSATVDPKSNIVQAAKTVSRAKLGISEWSTDLCFFVEAKISGVIFGAGENEVIHKPNEYCLISKLEKCKEIYSRIVEEYAKD